MLLLFVLVGVSYFIDFGSTGAVRPVLPLLVKAFHLTGILSGLLLTSAGVGGVIGAIFSGTISDRIGRKYLFVVSLVISSIGGVLSAYAWNFNALLLGRFLDGLGAGAVTPLILTYATEFIPAKRRGIFTPAVVVFSLISLPAAPFIALLTIPTTSYEGIFLFGAIAGFILAAMTAMFLPESVRFLIKHSRNDEAEKIVRDLVGDAAVDAARSSAPPQTHPAGSGKSTKAISWSQMFRGKYLKRTIGAYVLASCHGAASFGISGFIIAVWVTYSHMFTLPVALGISATIGLLNPVGPFLTMGGIQRFGRRRWLATVYAVTLVAYAGGAYSLSVRSPTDLIAFAALGNLFGTASFSSLATYTTELFPQSTRGMGTGNVQGLVRFGGVYGPLFFGLFIVTGYVYAYVTVAVLYAVAVVSIIATAYETRNKTLDQIEQELTTV